MKTIKRRIEQFSFYDYTGIERHLERMAQKGWRLSKITRFYWEYRAAEPRKLAYTVTYFSEASEFNPYPTENQQIFYEYCAEAGWELAAEWAQMQIFCSEQDGPSPIETDESVKLRVIHGAMKKNFLPSHALLLPLFLVQAVFQLHSIMKDPAYQLSNGISLFTAVASGVAILYSLISLIGYATWYRKAKKSIGMGEVRVESGGSYKKISYFLLLLLVLAGILLVSQHLSLMLLGGVNIAAIVALVLAVKHTLKRVGAAKRVNQTVTILSCAVLSLVLTGAMAWGVIRGVKAGWLGREPDEVHTVTRSNGSTWTWDIYRDPLPLRIEDLQAVDGDHYSYEWTQSESPLVKQYTAWQRSWPGRQDLPQLRYEIVETKLPVLFDLCLSDYLDRYGRYMREEERWEFWETDDATWQADAVYQLYRQDDAMSEYILCWGDRIVYIEFEEMPTAGQIAVAAEKLSH